MTYLDQTELERYSMSLRRLILEMERLNELDLLRWLQEVILRNPLSKQLNIIIDAEDGMIPWQFLINFVAVNFV
jgi:hypothetical protein